MRPLIDSMRGKPTAAHYKFAMSPVILGGMAMKYYGLRKSGPESDFVISDVDYQTLASRHPEKKDIWRFWYRVRNHFD